MADTQYDVSEKILRLYQLKQKQRNESKAFFARMMENPHRPIGEGTPFDSGLFRFSAMHTYHYEHFKPTPKNVFRYLCVIVLPVSLIYMSVDKTLKDREKLLRSGAVTYEDRSFKLVL